MRRQLKSVLILPVTVTLVVPTLLYVRCHRRQIVPASILFFTRIVGLPLIAVGAALLIFTVKDFIQIGQGTLAPWDPTRRLVVHGAYRYVRNPMISGVIAILVGTALILNTVCHFVWATLFTLANAIYIPISEEPDLEQRFGQEYQVYKQHVPRWIPRMRPWPSQPDTGPVGSEPSGD